MHTMDNQEINTSVKSSLTNITRYHRSCFEKYLSLLRQVSCPRDVSIYLLRHGFKGIELGIKI